MWWRGFRAAIGCEFLYRLQAACELFEGERETVNLVPLLLDCLAQAFNLLVLMRQMYFQVFDPGKESCAIGHSENFQLIICQKTFAFY